MGSVSDNDTPALATNPKIIFFTDFDGTITIKDSNDFMTEELGYGRELRLVENDHILYGRKSFREAFQGMMDSIKLPFDQCIATLRANIKLDPGFRDFFHWCRAHNVPIVILSGGMRPVIRSLLEMWLGDEASYIQIVSNDVAPRDGKSINDEAGWRIVYHDETPFGHDKSMEIRKYSARPDRPIMLYAGDGVSDLSAARETDLLFAKAGKDLVTYCERENVPFVTFQDFTSIHKTVEAIEAGTLTHKDAALGRIHT
ncbi:hypothetical protein VD0004_g6098 [Verticillium dahliae]|uniref:Uncharacterized protein n=1 Tax=Verticillium dahliae TaxID=27337 RepID=A0A366PKU0_VERDA|nr:Glucoamylase [Verticillium dahliae VDG1]PNH40935.1 hypothetical protein VD0004_g6098 [Verticillium dahliae]PNH67189.1 hypothetical protein VD0001_g7890 [Verticillium dahliae]RBQ93256.1 hypothetical protein VDGD_09911 [Verticillium dahliae]RXG43952.1 hypothetical protein VDGE_09911 [Verticillium dahliae]